MWCCWHYYLNSLYLNIYRCPVALLPPQPYTGISGSRMDGWMDKKWRYDMLERHYRPQLARNVNKAVLLFMLYNPRNRCRRLRENVKMTNPSLNSFCWEKKKHKLTTVKTWRNVIGSHKRKKTPITQRQWLCTSFTNTCVTKCLWVPVSGPVGRGSGGQRHNKSEQSALIGVCCERRARYES